jgi:hypothetical protein
VSPPARLPAAPCLHGMPACLSACLRRTAMVATRISMPHAFCLPLFPCVFASPLLIQLPCSYACDKAAEHAEEHPEHPLRLWEVLSKEIRRVPPRLPAHLPACACLPACVCCR